MGSKICDSMTKQNKANQNKNIQTQNLNNTQILPKPRITESQIISFQEAKNFLYYKCGISSSILDDQGTTKTGWRKGAKSGPPGYLKDYIPPISWTAIGLKVKNLYDYGNNEWIGTNNTPGEWYIGYHGVKTIEAIQNIYSQGFRRGDGQMHKNDPNKNPLNKNIYPICGEGVYFTPDISEAESYAQFIMYNNYNYKIVFMCRINPKYVKIADLGKNKEYWIVEGDKLGDLNGKKRSDVVRPYRILFKREPVQSQTKDNNSIKNNTINNPKKYSPLKNNNININNNISNFKTINSYNFSKNNFSNNFNNNLNNNKSNNFMNINKSFTQKFNNNKKNNLNKNNFINFTKSINNNTNNIFKDNNNDKFNVYKYLSNSKAFPDIKLNNNSFDYSYKNSYINNKNTKNNTNIIFINNYYNDDNKFNSNNNFPDIKLNNAPFDYAKKNNYTNFNKNTKRNTNHILGNNYYKKKNDNKFNNNHFPDIKLNNDSFDYSYKKSFINFKKNIKNNTKNIFRNNYFPDIKLNNSSFDSSKRSSDTSFSSSDNF